MDVKNVKCDICHKEVPLTDVWTCIGGTKKELEESSFIFYKRICKKCWSKAFNKRRTL